MTLPEFSVRQTVLVNVLFVVCMVGGWNALQLTEVEYFHDVTLNQVVITTQWTGASADEIERLVTTKLKEELSSVNNIDEMRSASHGLPTMNTLDAKNRCPFFNQERRAAFMSLADCLLIDLLNN